ATGSAGSKQLDMFGPRILEGNFAPGFFMKHFIKDMKLASEEAAQSDLKLNMLNTVLEEYKELEARGMGNLGTQALMKYFEPRV
ncbi:MAG: NAD(P)-dependent oxidoreductase, partial [Synergistaceae bacterium]|nr:NAD(P)-dependent oxidoreductase [Synergistaceae bacterium]